jgi:hypothetical protein
VGKRGVQKDFAKRSGFFESIKRIKSGEMPELMSPKRLSKKLKPSNQHVKRQLWIPSFVYTSLLLRVIDDEKK